LTGVVAVRTSTPRLGATGPLVLLWTLGCTVLGFGTASATEVPLASETLDLRQGDEVCVTLTHGGEICGHATAWVGEELSLRLAGGDSVAVARPVIERIRILSSTSERPLAQLAAAEPTSEDEARALRRKRARAGGLAVGSFFVPGLGQYAAGRPGLGSLYLFGTLVIDLSIVLSLVINEDPLVAIMLGGLDLASRITSATLARRDAMAVSVTVLPVPVEGEAGMGLYASVGVRW